MPSNILQFSAHLDNAYFFQGSNKREIYLYATLKAGKAPTAQERVPLNISLVVDRSGSMEGDKLNYVKKAVDFVIDNLNSNDYLSIVQYDNEVDVVSASTLVTDKANLHRKVTTIKARGMTNLSGGMLEGYNQVKNTQQSGFVNRTLLLSNGLANQGITEPDRLQQIAQKKFRDQGIALSTFGVGADFNELLMTQLSEFGGANYYFIEKPDQIPQIFAKELEGLLSVVAQNTKLTLQFPNSHFRPKKVYGYPAMIGQSDITVNFNDVFAEEEKAILIAFDVLQPIEAPYHFQLQLGYEDVVEKLETIEEQLSLTLQITENQETYQTGVHSLALQNVALFVANDLYEQCMEAVDKQQYDEAKSLLQQAKTYLEAYMNLYASEELQRQYEQILAYEQKLETLKEMPKTDFMMVQKMSRGSNYMSRKKR
ncbi:MAG: VWA domain-containing protein [Chitinophagales bacterium]